MKILCNIFYNFGFWVYVDVCILILSERPHVKKIVDIYIEREKKKEINDIYTDLTK